MQNCINICTNTFLFRFFLLSDHLEVIPVAVKFILQDLMLCFTTVPACLKDKYFSFFSFPKSSFSEPEKMKSMSQLAVLTRRWNPATMKLGPFQEVILESSSVEELKEKVGLHYWHS